MTKEEIIEIIHKTIYQFFDVCGDNEEVPLSDKDKLLLSVNKAICNNIKALEQEPCADAISRKTVLQMIENIQDAGGFIGYNTYSEAFDQVDNMPSVTPTRKKGKWINKNTNGYHFDCKCSECKLLVGDWYAQNMKYCPNCGAEME